MSFVKHVGEANGKKVIILQREIVTEPGMASILYADLLPQEIAQDIERELMSAEGQNAASLNDVLGRRMGTNGRIIIETLGLNGFVKKISTSNVLVKPNAKSSVRLDELNRILSQVGQGEEAKAKLAQLDASQGFTMPKPKAPVSTATVAERVAQLRSSAEALLEEAKHLEENAPKPVKRRRRPKALG